MVQFGYKKPFIDKHNLYLLINFRIEGYSLNSLASLFHCDKKAVSSQLKRFSISPENQVIIFKRGVFDGPTSLLSSNWKSLDGELINRGYTYAEYLKRCSPPNKVAQA